ncbi:MAG: hypothetical protein A2527_14315 [Candidatus Lambdaproteobacteria bacterium RIFOXYD2_FULL_50_16]|uniref:histidine kinase n=1 Tax=Candidatus Lambdaproteobacteria bacterium RIFOXYD2_FULL_50_16 TaxID=1817772 RepID=A0A1F6G4Q3_9PROT|nr:MAG: hypothetical protein A2527_14315 [Candidatus Lambdaproteobacteria bacterium RIFOXYD2_FULL_50_16]
MSETESAAKNTPEFSLLPEQESVWIEVIYQIDQAYAELVQTQVNLEASNEELAKARDFLVNIQRHMSDLLIVTSADARVIQVNQSFERLSGLSPDTVVNQPLESCFELGEENKLTRLLSNNRVIHRDLEIDLKTGGSPLRLSINSSPRFEADGAYAGLVLIGRPIGELQRAYKELERAHQELVQTQQQLIHAEKMASLGRLVAGVAHEMNNPFSFVFANLHILETYLEHLTLYLTRLEAGRSPTEIETLRQGLPIAKLLKDLKPLIDGSLEGTSRVEDIIAGLKQFSSSQAKERVQFDLAKMARTALGWVKGKLSLTFEDKMPPELWVWAPPGQINQVVLNLLQNAADALENQDQPRIELEAGTKGEESWLMVRDFGTGIKESDLSKIWEPFFTTKPIGQGTGLGLAISLGIVENLGGSIKAQNHPGGAEFILTLPTQGERG